MFMSMVCVVIFFRMNRVLQVDLSSGSQLGMNGRRVCGRARGCMSLSMRMSLLTMWLLLVCGVI